MQANINMLNTWNKCKARLKITQAGVNVTSSVGLFPPLPFWCFFFFFITRTAVHGFQPILFPRICMLSLGSSSLDWWWFCLQGTFIVMILLKINSSFGRWGAGWITPRANHPSVFLPFIYRREQKVKDIEKRGKRRILTLQYSANYIVSVLIHQLQTIYVKQHFSLMWPFM